MKAVRTICGEYAEDDIYNMDETGLHWRSAVHRGPPGAPLPGRTHEKSSITLALCTNATGSDRLPVWIIGHARQPRALGGLNLEALGCRWRSNKKAWMTTAIMGQWLTAFYHHVGSRSVMLCMDNLAAHMAGVEAAPPPSNVHVVWLAENSTTVFQPLDQGILQNLKLHYRKAWLGYIVTSIDHGINPFTSVTLDHALHWCVEAWHHRVDNPTIYRCFRKSAVIRPAIHLPAAVEPDLSIEYRDLQQRIDDALPLERIVHPAGENERRHPVDEEPSLEEMIERHTGTEIQDEDARLEDVEPDYPPLLPTTAQALQAVRLLQVYQEHRPSTQPHHIQRLRQWERHWCSMSVHSPNESTLP